MALKDTTQRTIDEIETESEEIQSAVDKIIKPYCKELDDYVDRVNDCLINADVSGVTDDELEDFVLNLSTLIYYVSTGAENMGIRDDMSRTLYKAAYNNARSLITTGTVADKNSLAEMQSYEEHLVNVIYNKAYKLLKSKSDSAQEILSSCKKIMSRRMKEMELSRTQINS